MICQHSRLSLWILRLILLIWQRQVSHLFQVMPKMLTAIKYSMQKRLILKQELSTSIR